MPLGFTYLSLSSFSLDQETWAIPTYTLVCMHSYFIVSPFISVPCLPHYILATMDTAVSTLPSGYPSHNQVYIPLRCVSVFLSPRYSVSYIPRATVTETGIVLIIKSSRHFLRIRSWSRSTLNALLSFLYSQKQTLYVHMTMTRSLLQAATRVRAAKLSPRSLRRSRMTIHLLIAVKNTGDTVPQHIHTVHLSSRHLIVPNQKSVIVEEYGHTHLKSTSSARMRCEFSPANHNSILLLSVWYSRVAPV